MVSDETRLSSDFFAHYGCNHDINECEEHGHRCGAHGTCLESYSNTAVSFNAFQCRCDKGWMNGYCEYALMGNVLQTDEWLESERLCNVVETTPGSNERRFSGFPSDTYNGTFCNIDVDECDGNPCADSQLCIDSTDDDTIPIGEYMCIQKKSSCGPDETLVRIDSTREDNVCMRSMEMARRNRPMRVRTKFVRAMTRSTKKQIVLDVFRDLDAALQNTTRGNVTTAYVSTDDVDVEEMFPLKDTTTPRRRPPPRRVLFVRPKEYGGRQKIKIGFI